MSRSQLLLIILSLLYAGFFLIERFFSLRALRSPSLLRRLVSNAAMSAFAFLASAALVQPAVAKSLELSQGHGFGLMNYLPLPWWLSAILAFLLLDLSFYYWHRLNHENRFLFRFHAVHHSDPDLDVSTGFRFHPIEVGISSAFRVVQITLIGVAPLVYFSYELLFQIATLFHHSNIRIPRSLERILNWFFVTPRMHGLHHSFKKHQTNSNYSVVFSFWDRLHRSLTPIDKPQESIGVPAYDQKNDNQIWALLSAPFKKQRNYWFE